LSSNEIMVMIHVENSWEKGIGRKQRTEAILRLNGKIFKFNHLYKEMKIFWEN
jgi:hypothetical protein